MASSHQKITQAIFPVAGLGTRFLPVTKTVAKELLPVLNRPLIDYAIEEAFEAGIERIIMVTGRNKSALEDYFDHVPELEEKLKANHKNSDLKKVILPIQQAKNIAFVRQLKALGLGHAIWSGRNFIDQSKPFAVICPDDLILDEQGCLSQMQEAYKEVGGNIVAVMNVPLKDVSQYGILSTPNPNSTLPIVEGLVEKPSPQETPSTLSIVGRYFLQPSIMRILDDLPPSVGGEIQITDAIACLIGKEPVHGFRFTGTRFDCGSIEGWLAANNAYYAYNKSKSG